MFVLDLTLHILLQHIYSTWIVPLYAIRFYLSLKPYKPDRLSFRFRSLFLIIFIFSFGEPVGVGKTAKPMVVKEYVLTFSSLPNHFEFSDSITSILSDSIGRSGEKMADAKSSKISLSDSLKSLSRAWASGSIILAKNNPNYELGPLRLRMPVGDPGGVSSRLLYWWDAQDLDADGIFEGFGEAGMTNDKVDTWVNKVSGAPSLTATGALEANTTKPAFKENEDGFNFNSSISFNQSGSLDDYLGALVNDFTEDRATHFVVLKTTSAGDETILSFNSTSDHNEFKVSDPTSLDVTVRGAGANFSENYNINHSSIMTIVRDGDDISLYKNSNGSASNPIQLSLSGNDDQDGYLVLGQNQDSHGGGFSDTKAFIGSIAEVISYERDISNADRNQIESYLALKYGITIDQSTARSYLASNGIEIWDAFENSVYKTHIAAIGRDNASTLYQPKSKSVNGGSILTISSSTGVIADGNFMVWANNNQNASSFQVVDIGADRFVTLSRQWYIQEKSFVEDGGSNIGTPTDIGLVEVQFDLTGIDYKASEVKLLVDDDGQFGTGTTVSSISGTFVGDVVIFSGVNLTDGEFVGLTTKSLLGPGGETTNLRYWLDAQDLDGDGVTEGASEIGINAGEVETWINQIPGAASFTATGGLEPATTKPDFLASDFNFNSAVEFNLDGSSKDYLGTLVDDFPTSHITQFVVMRSSSSGTNESALSYSLDQVGENTDEFSFFNSNNLKVTLDGVSSNSSGLDFSTGNPVLLSLDRSSTTDRLNLYKDGGGLYTEVISAAHALEKDGYFFLGQDQDSPGGGFEVNNAFQGSIAEVITFGEVLDATKRQKIESYLALKYGISLNQSTAQDYLASNAIAIWDASEDLNYKTHIAGIGRDDNTGLFQPKSKVTSGDGILTIESNTGTIADGNFLVWSSNSASAPASVPADISKERFNAQLHWYLWK